MVRADFRLYYTDLCYIPLSSDATQQGWAGMGTAAHHNSKSSHSVLEEITDMLQQSVCSSHL